MGPKYPKMCWRQSHIPHWDTHELWHLQQWEGGNSLEIFWSHLVTLHLSYLLCVKLHFKISVGGVCVVISSRGIIRFPLIFRRVILSLIAGESLARVNNMTRTLRKYFASSWVFAHLLFAIVDWRINNNIDIGHHFIIIETWRPEISQIKIWTTWGNISCNSKILL